MRPLQSWIVNVGTPKAVRRIPINTISLTGEVLGQEFESSLERDLIQLISFHDNLDWFQVQPCKIHFRDGDGRQRSYTPDLLVSFVPREPLAGGTPVAEPPLLCEVKYRAELARSWRVLKPKFKAARAYAREQGWEFRIFTEDRIRTPYFKNIQFLWSYRHAPFHDARWEGFLYELNEIGVTTVNGLLNACFQPEDKVGRGEGIWTIWCMIATKDVLCDLHLPLSMNTPVWIHPKWLLANHPEGR